MSVQRKRKRFDNNAGGGGGKKEKSQKQRDYQLTLHELFEKNLNVFQKELPETHFSQVQELLPLQKYLADSFTKFHKDTPFTLLFQNHDLEKLEKQLLSGFYELADKKIKKTKTLDALKKQSQEYKEQIETNKKKIASLEGGDKKEITESDKKEVEPKQDKKETSLVENQSKQRNKKIFGSIISTLVQNAGENKKKGSATLKQQQKTDDKKKPENKETSSILQTDPAETIKKHAVERHKQTMEQIQTKDNELTEKINLILKEIEEIQEDLKILGEALSKFLSFFKQFFQLYFGAFYTQTKPSLLGCLKYNEKLIENKEVFSIVEPQKNRETFRTELQQKFLDFEAFVKEKEIKILEEKQNDDENIKNQDFENSTKQNENPEAEDSEPDKLTEKDKESSDKTNNNDENDDEENDEDDEDASFRRWKHRRVGTSSNDK